MQGHHLGLTVAGFRNTPVVGQPRLTREGGGMQTESLLGTSRKQNQPGGVHIENEGCLQKKEGINKTSSKRGDVEEEEAT